MNEWKELPAPPADPEGEGIIVQAEPENNKD